jgi:D-beta-D-heptose 7-phosphate kinase/D-beta-D-heptose 1-phosphate adenosyltransferase
LFPIQLFDRFPRLVALVLGDPILDSFLEGIATRLCVESPVPVILRQGESDFPGGAANTAANLAALAARVHLVGLTGDDPARDRLAAALARHGVAADGLVSDAERATTFKLRILAGRQYIARIDDERAPAPTPHALGELLRNLESAYREADVVVVSDYGLGSASAEAMALLEDLRRRRPRPLLIDSKNLLRHAHVHATLVTPNLQEAYELAGVDPRRDLDRETLEQLGARLLERLASDRVAITLGPAGVFLAERGQAPACLAAPAVPVANEVGAGDSFTACAALALAAGADGAAAARLGMEAAAVAVSKPRTAVVSAQELRERLLLLGAAERRATTDRGVARLAARAEQIRRRGKTIVFTNGVFDLFHQGHLALLRRAKQLGDVLVVAINSDGSARSLKGNARPINPEAERVAVVAGLDCVDHALLFDSATAADLIVALRPDVYVKGDDHDPATLPEADAVRAVGARLVILPRLGTLSTSRIIDRIVASAAPNPVAGSHAAR